MKKQALFVLGLTSLSAMAQVSEDRIRKLESKIEDLEFSQLEQTTKINGTLELRHDNASRNNGMAYTSLDDSGSQTVGAAKDSVSLNRMWLQMNITSKPSDRLTFYGRLSMAKYFNSLTSQYGGGYNSAFSELSAGASTGNSTLYVERAFANYRITDSLIFTAGRLPTIDGAPKHMSWGTSLQGNYPILGFSGIFDGAALTYTAPIGAFTTNYKFIYTPIATLNMADRMNPVVASDGKSQRNSTDSYALVFEALSEKLTWTKNFSFIAFYQKVNGLPIANGTTTISSNPLAGSVPGFAQTQSNLDLGLEKIALNLEAHDIADLGVDASLSYGHSKTNSEGLIKSCYSATSTGAFNCSAVASQTIGGWLTNQSNDSKKGDIFISNVRYKLPFSPATKFGYEFMKSSANAFVYDAAALNPVGFYNSRGAEGHHFYLIHEVDSNLRVRVGYQGVRSRSTSAYNGLIGGEQGINRKLMSVYASVVYSF